MYKSKLKQTYDVTIFICLSLHANDLENKIVIWGIDTFGALLIHKQWSS